MTKKIHKYANLIPEMSENDFNQLKEDISKNGLIEPIVLYEDEILDGRHRYRACNLLNIQPMFKNYDGENPIQFVVSKNINRRHLTTTQRAVLAVELLPIYEEEAKKRQLAGIANLKQFNESPVVTKLSQPVEKQIPVKKTENDKSRDLAAAACNVSQGYISEVKKIAETEPELFQQMKSGNKTMQEAKREIKKAEQIERFKELEQKETKVDFTDEYDVVVIDPPWEMKKIDRDCSPEQTGFDYPTMTLEEIKAFTIPAAENCHLFLWTTHKYLPLSFDIISNWGFKYVFTMVWHKNGGFQPFNLPQYNCEFCLYAKKGVPEFKDTKNFFTCFNANRTGHSKKPDEFYDIVRRTTAGKKIDIFNRRDILGFDKWGNEA